MKKVALIGYAGHALVVADVLEQVGYQIIGYFEKTPVKNNPLQIKYLGYESPDNIKSLLNNTMLFPAIGDNQIRQRIVEFILDLKIQIAIAISPKANVSTYASIGQGTLVCPGVCINSNANIGIGAIINTGAIIEHECIIKDYVHIAPGSVLAGNVCIGENSFIGANSVVKQGTKIGRNVIIGAGAVIINDISDNEVWIGNPSRRLDK
jgi:sugar O-acyltransferase (sialic acid O-acetyltransferase NeuD family)